MVGDGGDPFLPDLTWLPGAARQVLADEADRATNKWGMPGQVRPWVRARRVRQHDERPAVGEPALNPDGVLERGARRELRQRERPDADHERSVHERELPPEPRPAGPHHLRRGPHVATARSLAGEALRDRSDVEPAVERLLGPEAGGLEPPAQAAAGGADE